MIYDTVIEKPFSKTNECVYWQYSSKNADFITGMSLTVLLWSDGVQNRVSVAKRCKRYYVTNATGKSITRQQIVKEYRDRWKIEVLFRNLKQLFHLEECQNRKTIAQKHYVYACIHALMLLGKQNQRSLYEAKKYFQRNFIDIKHNGNKALRLLAA